MDRTLQERAGGRRQSYAVVGADTTGYRGKHIKTSIGCCEEVEEGEAVAPEEGG